MPAKLSGPLVLCTVVAALLGACYDMPLIPADSVAVAGAAGRDGASAGAGRGGAGTSAGAGAGGARPSSSGAPNAQGGTKPNGGGGASAGGAGTSEASAGMTGEAGSAGTAGVTWLALSGSKAPSSFETNAELGIEGLFYVYGDGCSKLLWDSAGRCASGKICDPAQGYWGISIGFDFRHTGADDTPANTTLIWNPDDHGARGVAWQIRGTAPQLQVWVLNMASSWNGQCPGMPCEISGPPDGVIDVPLNGELDFDHMHKDYWGGSGTDYEFDPAAVHALQFKIAAVKVGTAEFNFCIDALGIVH